jgi:hypothetical protein
VCTPPCTCILKHTHSCIFMHTDDTYHTNRTRKCTCVLTITQTQVCINVTGTHIVMSLHSHTHKESWVTCLLRPRLVRMCALCQLESKSLSVNARSEPAAQVSWESTESPRPPLTLWLSRPSTQCLLLHSPVTPAHSWLCGHLLSFER